MTEPLFNIEVFNQKTTQEKIDYLFNCLLNLPDKDFNESPVNYATKIKQAIANTDINKEEASDMRYMLNLVKKYKKTGEEDNLIIKDYTDYVETQKSSL
jgi:hypothetical protein